jgi:predicted O-methyltransferase YrrM
MSLQVGNTGLSDLPRRWDVLESFMAQQGYKTFVEVGCKEGRTTGHILKTIPDARVIAIDPWMAQEKSKDPTKETYADWDFADIEKQFWENVGENKDRCTMERMTSEQASDEWAKRAPAGWSFVEGTTYGETKPNQADLIFIDALHDYEHVKQDIGLWWPKVRVGGILAGHDFNHRWPGCERAVAESFNLMHVGVAPDSVWFVIKVHEDQYRGA